MNPKSPCCKQEMAHLPDKIHYHYRCMMCDKEYELDGKTKYMETYQLHEKLAEFKKFKKENPTVFQYLMKELGYVKKIARQP